MGSDDTDTEGGDEQGRSEMDVPSVNATMGQPSKRAAVSKRESNKQTIITTPDGKKLRRKIKPRKKEDESNAMIKYGSLFLLVAQMVGLVLLMRYSRTSAVESEDTQLYLASTAVFLMEAMKFAICLVVIFVQSGSSPSALYDELYEHVWNSPFEVLKLCVPSLLYTVQNNLLYLALTNLDAATYQVCYQLKILTTALFSATLLQRSFSRLKWMSLVILTIGVAIVQLSGSGDKHHHVASEDEASRNRMVGLVAVLCAACTSGFAGVYFERILKGSSTTLWLRNIQMGLPSVIIAYIGVYMKDSMIIAEKGFFVGYTPLVWTVVTVQAVGGLIVAVVVKYADNVLKVFATSFSIIISCIISAVVFDFRPNFLFVCGASLVMASTVMYSRPDTRRRKKPILPMTMSVNKGARKSSLVM
eukprot:CAMPEP_0198304154 /NCGR_PEP_ID=MMETSP1449-20131203/57256_1 /TAXON_ID=420275 /ORGANISM="Attheya septentrionalis, Strain CCMP2084" /LENGTH=416 /DNA_ID=CAMNT_0044006669 /DNA_START=8 /DNA_END=1258 /DNA_ORIENTATION=+